MESPASAAILSAIESVEKLKTKTTITLDPTVASHLHNIHNSCFIALALVTPPFSHDHNAAESGQEGFIEHYRDDSSFAVNDGYSWKKYGKKDIKDFDYPKHYYRCLKCGARKHVQQIEENPISIYRTSYLDPHNCDADQSVTTSLPPFPMEGSNMSTAHDDYLSFDVEDHNIFLV